MNKRITQRDLAKIANVSPMCISLALRNHSSISSKTRLRIKKLAIKHNYRPDPALAVLNAYRNAHHAQVFHGTLGWVTNFSSRDGWKSMIQVEGYFEGALRRADELGYRLEPFWIAESGLTSNRATDILLTRGIKGLIIAPQPQAFSELKLNWSHFPSVTLGYSLKSPKLHVIMSNQFRNMKAVVQQLYKMGHSRIGLAMPAQSDQRVDHNYLGGFLVAQSEFARDTAKLPPLLAKSIDKQTFLNWFTHNNPDAVIISPTTIDMVSQSMAELNLKVPEDISLATASIPYNDKTISGIDEGVTAIGSQAVDVLVGMIHRNDKGVPNHQFSLLIEGDWNRGVTAQCRNLH